MLICKFATPRSRPEKIRDWISYLEDLARRCESDADSRQTLELLLNEARTWTPQAAVA